MITELRLGNLFYPIDRNLEGGFSLIVEIPFKVCSIGFQVRAVHHNKIPAQVERWNEFHAKDLSPISLTEEWLLQFGFNKEYKQGYIGKDFSNQDFVLTEPLFIGECQKSYAFEFSTDGCFKYKEFNYVHELQNFYFAMTGLELSVPGHDR